MPCRPCRSKEPWGSFPQSQKTENGNKKKKIIIGVLIALIVLVLGFAAAVYGYIQHNFGKMNGQNNFDIADVRNENISLEMRDKMEKGYWTIAVFGLDSRDNSTGKGNQSDVIMIVNLNRETGESSWYLYSATLT